MRHAASLFGLAVVACGLWASAAKADILATYTFLDAQQNPNTQGWTWNNEGNVIASAGNFLIQETSAAAGDAGNFLFTETVPANAFYEAWEMSGTMRFPGNGQTTLGMVLFADDGTNFWHMSFYNVATPADGIYMGDPGVMVYADTPGPGGDFDAFLPWSLKDSDGLGGAPPSIHKSGVDLGVAAVPLPSRFPAGTVGFGSLNDNEGGFFQITAAFFEGNPNAIPEPGAIMLAGLVLLGLVPLGRRFRRK